MSRNLFQYCQKLVIVSKDQTMVLLGRRKSEKDYNGVFSFFGGKMENTDTSILEGLRREKNEEIGSCCWIELYLEFSTNYTFQKQDGNYMIIPHYYAEFGGGKIMLCNEYSEYKWLHVNRLDSFEPKIPTISEIVRKLLALSKMVGANDLMRI